MPAFRRLSIALLIALAVSTVQAADAPQNSCLSKAEQRAAVASHSAVPLAVALKAPRERARHPEVIRARLCHNGDKLIYMLTLLGHSGKVFTATVDAASGAPVSVR